jgi:hypothetical protein
MKKSFIILISIAIILTGCIHSDNNILTHDNEKQPKQEYEKEKPLVFNMRNDLFEESKSLQMFPIPDKAILVDKTFKYATFNLRGKYNLPDIMPLYLQEFEKMGWFKEKHFGQQWTFENEGVRVHFSAQEDSFTIREIEVYSAQ